MIYACCLKDDLVDRARAGDPAAIEALLRFLPENLPATERIAERDRRIRTMAISLAASLPGVRTDRLAHLLDAAGRQVSAGRRELHGDLLQQISTEERAWLVAQIVPILRFARWPKARQLFDILK